MLKLNFLIIFGTLLVLYHLNTSHVKVKLKLILFLEQEKRYLNTSHVKVKQKQIIEIIDLFM